ncbi:MAG TPA: DUF2232 domain-containing protein [Gemmatimonadales bacterium]|nr:DUF2232 domain-containing protein [Gemmatimonadales bacterium]
MAGYVLLTWPVMVVFFLGPLAVLLLASRPLSRREWLWFAALVVWLGLWSTSTGGLLDQVIRAAGILAIGIGAPLLLVGTGTMISRALQAVGVMTAGTSALCAFLDIRWRDVELAALRQGWAAYNGLIQQAGNQGAAVDPVRAQGLEAIADALRPMASIFPGLMALFAFAGLLLAARWARRIAPQPAIPPLAPFRDFRFTDQLVWLVVAGLAGVLFPVPPEVHDPAASMLFFGSGLYALRGAAVLWTAVARAPRVVVAALVLGALFLLPFVLGGCVLLGLADTWLDFRRRMKPPQPGGLDQ